MPIYGYECTQCGHHLEVLQSVSEPPLRVCPECQGELRKLLYPVGVIFKGSGFYSTDYKSGSSNGKSTSDSSGDTKSSGDSKPDNKPESKPDSKPSGD